MLDLRGLADSKAGAVFAALEPGEKGCLNFFPGFSGYCKIQLQDTVPVSGRRAVINRHTSVVVLIDCAIVDAKAYALTVRVNPPFFYFDVCVSTKLLHLPNSGIHRWGRFSHTGSSDDYIALDAGHINRAGGIVISIICRGHKRDPVHNNLNCLGQIIPRRCGKSEF